MQKLNNRDIGSSFYTLHPDDREYKVLEKQQVSLKQNYSFYYSGRNAMLAILKHIETQQNIQTIWLPNYYCDTVVNLLQANYKAVKQYTINPFDDFDKPVNFDIFSKEKDIVILNNFWGLSSFKYDTKSTITVIEDHTHGWLSEACLNSKADYCIAAIRKYYPIPTGGIAWQPKSNFEFYEATEDESILEAWNTLDDSMKLKRQFIKDNNESVKAEYLKLLQIGDTFLTASNSYIKPSETAVDYLKDYVAKNPNAIKHRHLKHIQKHIEDSKDFKILKREGFIPFGLLLVFKDASIFQEFKRFMVSHNIYPAHLWPNNTINLNWKYVLNIHVDFRYSLNDMDYIIETINHWINRKR